MASPKCALHPLASRGQDAEVRAIMQEIDAVEGVSKVQLSMAISAW